jgi:hypothetical protein
MFTIAPSLGVQNFHLGSFFDPASFIEIGDGAPPHLPC